MTLRPLAAFFAITFALFPRALEAWSGPLSAKNPLFVLVASLMLGGTPQAGLSLPAFVANALALSVLATWFAQASRGGDEGRGSPRLNLARRKEAS